MSGRSLVALGADAPSVPPGTAGTAVIVTLISNIRYGTREIAGQQRAIEPRKTRPHKTQKPS
jgi:hypothetical protein